MLSMIENVLLKEVENERVLMDAQIYYLFSRIRLFFPLFKKNFQLGLFISLTKFLILTSYLSYLGRDKLLQLTFSWDLMFAYFHIITGFFGSLIKGFIVLYYFAFVIKEDETLTNLKAKVRKLVVSRVYSYQKSIGYFSTFFNLIQLIFQATRPGSFLQSNLFQLNLLISVIFFIQLGVMSKKMNQIFIERIPSEYVQELVETFRVFNYDISLQFTECSICFEKYEVNEELIELKCLGKHVFHSQCIKNWFSYQTKCPLCKKIE